MPKADALSAAAVSMLREPQIAQFGTVMADGAPQVTPVWVDVEDDGRHVLINTVEGRLKADNTLREPRVAVSVVDGQNPYRYVIVRGEVAERRHDGAVDHIHKLAKKYLNQDSYPWLNDNEQRVILRIKPTHVIEQGL
jgi:PPOX class probable F420-dependent enzyme